MATEAFIIAITTQGTREVSRDFKQIGTDGASASKAADQVGAAASRAQQKLVGLGTGFQVAANAARLSQANIQAFGNAVNTMVRSMAANGLGQLPEAIRAAGLAAQASTTEMNRLGVAIQKATSSASISQMRNLGTAIRAVGAAAATSQQQMSRLGAAISNATRAQGMSGMRNLGTAMTQFGAASQAVTTRVNGVRTAFGTLGGLFASAGQRLAAFGAQSQTASRGIESLNGTLGLMRNALVAFSFVRAIAGLGEFASTAVNMENKLTTITQSATQMEAVMGALGDTSIRTRTNLETNVDTFTRLARSTGSLHLSYQQLIDLTRGIADTVHIAGASSQQASRALMDFAEGLAAGSLQGRQLRAMVMQLPTLGDAIAKSFGLAGSQLMGFLKLHPGALSPEAIVKALQSALPGLDATIGKTQVTFAQAFGNMHTKLLIFYQDMDRAYGISKKVSDALTYVGDHIGAIAEFLAVLAAIGALAVTLGFITALITDFGLLYSVLNFLTGGLLKLSIAIIAIPFELIATGITVFMALGAAINVVIDVIEGVGVAFDAVVAIIVGLSSIEVVIGLMLDLISAITIALPMLGLVAVGVGALALAGTAAYDAIAGLLSPLSQLTALADPLKQMNITIKDIPDVFQAAFTTVVENFPLITKALTALWDDMVNGMANRFNQFNNNVARNVTLNTLPSSAYEPENLPTNSAQAPLKQLGQKLAQNYANIKMTQAGGAMAAFLPGTPGALAGKPVVAGGKPLDENAGKPGQLQQAQQAFDQFLGQFAPLAVMQAKMDDLEKMIAKSVKSHVDILGSLNRVGIQANSISEARVKIAQLVQREVLGVGNADLKNAQDLALLNDAYKHNIVTQNEYLDNLLKIHSAQLAANPSNTQLGVQVGFEKNNQKLRNTGDIGEGLAQQAAAFDTAPQMAAIQTNILNGMQQAGTISAAAYAHAMEDVLKSQHDLASGEALAALKSQNEMLDQAAIAASALNGVYERVNAPEKFVIQLKAINDAVAQNPALMQSATVAVRDLNIAMLSTQQDALSGFQRGILDTQKTLGDFAATAQSTITTAFSNMTDALTTFFDTGKLNVKSFVDGMLGNLTKLAVQGAITGPLANALGPDQAGNGGLAGSGSILATIFGGTGLGGIMGQGTAQLGSSSSNPLYVTFASDGSLIASLSNPQANATAGSAASAAGADLFGGGNTSPGAAAGGGLMSSLGLGNIFGGSGSLPQSGTGGSMGSSIGSMISGLFGGGGASAAGKVAAGASSGGIGGMFDDISSFLGFAGGGDMLVGGQGGTDSQFVPFKATPGEIVSVRRPGDSGDSGNGGGGTTVHLHVHGVKDADSFQRSSNQIMGTLSSQVQRVSARDGRQVKS